MQLQLQLGDEWRVRRVACGKVDDAVRQTTNDRLAYNYNNVDADDDEVQPETGKRRGDREQIPWCIAKPQEAGQLLLLEAAVSCGKDTQKPSQGKGKYWHSLSECSRRQAGSQG